MAQYITEIAELDYLLSTLPTNTINTAYSIMISNLTASDFAIFSDFLQSVAKSEPQKYFSLEWDDNAKAIIKTIYDFTRCFQNAATLVSVDLTPFTHLAIATSMFSGCTALRNADGISNFSNMYTAVSMFRNCTALTSLNISGCKRLQFAMSMFENCTALTSVIITGMNNVADANSMFKGCSELRSYNSETMSLLQTTSSMFENCTKLTNVNTIGMKHVFFANHMFWGCSSLSNINMENFIEVNEAIGMFEKCSNLTQIDISKMKKLRQATIMFELCTKLTTAKLNGLSSLTESQSMFRKCSSLVTVDMKGTNNIEDAGPAVEGYMGMFGGCSSLTEIHGWEIPPTIELTDCFKDCSSLSRIYTSESYNIPITETKWNIWEIKKDSTNKKSLLKITNANNTYEAEIPSIKKYTFECQGYVDEIYFSSLSSISSRDIQKLFITNNQITADKTVLDPAANNFVIMAKDPNFLKTNLFTDRIEVGNKLAPTSEAVQAAIASSVTSVLPTGTILDFMGSVAPSGFLICNGNYYSKTEYAALYAIIGDRYNGTNTPAGNFRVPDFRNRVSWGASGNLGNYIEAAIPNLTGKFGPEVVRNHANYATGVFYGTDFGGEKSQQATGSSSATVYGFGIDASRASGVYKNGVNTVQPPAVAVNKIIKY